MVTTPESPKPEPTDGDRAPFAVGDQAIYRSPFGGVAPFVCEVLALDTARWAGGQRARVRPVGETGEGIVVYVRDLTPVVDNPAESDMIRAARAAGATGLPLVFHSGIEAAARREAEEAHAEAIAKGSRGPGFTQRMLPELMREQARWVKSMPPTAASLLERAAAELDELVTLRRLHEEATSRAATIRNALERVIEARDDHRSGRVTGVSMFNTIEAARKVLEGVAPEEAPLRWTTAAVPKRGATVSTGRIMLTRLEPLDPARFESTDYYRAKPHKAANDLIEALAEARGETKP